MTTPDLDPAADAFVDEMMQRLGDNTDRKVLRLALLMAYTAGYRDCVHAEVVKLAARCTQVPA
jgi:hypothetical protein